MFKRKKYLFGPVKSRRLGISLGIDLLPYKTCSLDCVYCECGPTTTLTVECRQYLPEDAVLAELGEYLKEEPTLDYITFAGSGEPTLHRGIGVLINWLKEHFSRYAVAVLTNGTLLQDPQVRARLERADLVVPSLDAASQRIFEKINRPHSSLSCAGLISGLAQFRREYKGELCLEVFIVPGLNDTPAELARLRQAIHRINPNRLQLNTLDRLGTEEWVRPASDYELSRCARLLGGGELVAGLRRCRPIPPPMSSEQ